MGARGGGGEPPPSAGDGEGDRSALTGGSAKKARSCSGLANRVRIACVAAQCGESDDAECEGEEGGCEEEEEKVNAKFGGTQERVVLYTILFC